MTRTPVYLCRNAGLEALRCHLQTGPGKWSWVPNLGSLKFRVPALWKASVKVAVITINHKNADKN